MAKFTMIDGTVINLSTDGYGVFWRRDRDGYMAVANLFDPSPETLAKRMENIDKLDFDSWLLMAMRDTYAEAAAIVRKYTKGASGRYRDITIVKGE